MKVLFVYKYLTVGGVETVLATRLAGLPDLGVDARAWFLHPGPGEEILDGLEARYRVGNIGALAKALREVPYDLIASIDTEEIFPLFRRRRDLPPLILEVHTPYQEHLAYLQDLGDVPLRAILVPSKYQGRVLASRILLPAPMRVVPNPLAPGFFEPPVPMPPGPNGPVVCWVGRLDSGKNWGAFLELASALKELEGGLRIWMAGSSPQPQEEADFWQRARSMGLAGCLRWFRQLPQGAVVRLLDALRAEGGVFVSTSRADSFGLTVAEAMARGCAVVVPRYGPFPEYVRNEENGLLYSPGGSGALQAVLRLLDNADLRRRLGEQAQRDIRARHAPRLALRDLSRALSWAARLGEGGSGAERQASH